MYNKFYEDISKVKIKSLGDKTVSKFKNLGVKTLLDLFYYFPKTYEDRTNIKTISDITGDETVILKAKLISIDNIRTRTKKTMTRGRISDGTGILDVIWFQMPYLIKSMNIGEEYIFYGKIKKGFNFQLTNPEYKKLNDVLSEEIKPVYSSTASLTQNLIRKITRSALTDYVRTIPENIPEEILKKYKLLTRQEALINIHFPRSKKDIEDAKRRFAVEELLILELGILSKRFEVELNPSSKYQLENKKTLVKKYLSTLGFELTNAQKRVITEIYKDLNNGKIVNRLIQGDVGSGKTIVAIIKLLYMVENSYQGVLMAPTEILAVQHYLGMVDSLNEIGIRVELLTGSIKGKKRVKFLEEIKLGLVDIVIGTHALIEDGVEFNRLGLIVIDEQHRFGVAQRKKLRDKGLLSNLIVMSATPIPRSLALSIYGDLDVSIIDELPPGRTPIKTKWIRDNIDIDKMYDFIDKKISEGRQAYFVAPLIEESEKLSAKSTEELFSEIRDRFPNYNIGLLHGKMKNSEKEEVMSEFKRNNIQILVSTTVVEVGVNVPNAVIMVISNSERFGLSALHQLRGRVGRGVHKSYCFLVSNTNNDISISRMRVMEATNDGFKIAEEDLKLRKPGEIFGTRQSGMSDLKFVDIVHDIKTIKLVRELSIEYLKKHSGKIDNKILSFDIEKKFSEIK